MELKDFYKVSAKALEHIDASLGGLELDELDVQLAGDVLTLSFKDGGRFVINAHSAALQIWLAAGTEAWHFDFDGDRWIARKSGDELMATVARAVSDRLGTKVSL